MKKIVLVFIVGVFQLTSCGYYVSWNKYSKWKSDDESLILFAFDQSQCGYGLMKNHGHYNDVYWRLANGNFRTFFCFFNISDNNGDFYHATFHLEKNYWQNTFILSSIVPSADDFKDLDMEFWKEKSITMHQCDIDESFIDAKYFKSTLFCSETNTYFGYSGHYFYSEYYFLYHDGKYYLYFLSDYNFAMKNKNNEILSIGTYSTKKDEVNLFFIKDAIFGLQENTMSLIVK